ncbi:MAG TPA: 6-phosphogluconolactonase [Actinomycetes bacterium]|nr:6-phosphogluconolactonase [Actinomycetes bacterium]
MNVPEIVVHRDAAQLADAIAARLITGLVEVQAAQAGAHLVLTGGSIGTALLTAVRASAARDAVDWTRVDVWWGDERFVPEGHPDRNEGQARAALLDHVPVPAGRVHPIAGSAAATTPEEAADRYARELATAPGARGGLPTFDVLLLGIGPDAHVASLFPEQPALHDTEHTVLAVHGAPKPPPMRVTLTMRAIRSAREVWLVTAGAEKAAAVRLALDPHAGPLQVPASAAHGRRRTLFLIDEAAAADLPKGLERIASP